MAFFYTPSIQVAAPARVRPPFARSRWAHTLLLLAASAASTAQAQQAGTAQPKPAVSLAPVVVSERSSNVGSDFLGLGDAPLSRTPLSASVVDAAQIDALGATRLADLIKLDASVSDAYNTVGYWDYATVRGFVLDNRYNFRREGLPISAETSIALDNKDRVEILKGTSGMQAGTSAPGGIVNYVVKRPTNDTLRSVRLSTTSDGDTLAAVDLGGRFGANKEFGYRLNASAENLNSYADATHGTRNLLALAMDWRLGRDAILEAELESAHRSQPSVPGLSLLGTQLPAPNARLNLNNQPWSLPVVLDGVTGTLRFEQALNSDWRWSLQAGTQRLKSDDRAAFPFGPNYADGYISYGANGDYDLYDYRSENERRNLDALQAQLRGRFNTGSVSHELVLAALASRTTVRTQAQAYNYVGTGNFATLPTFAPDPSVSAWDGNRNERSTEISAMDAISWTAQFKSWLGVRQTRMSRGNTMTDGTVLASYDQSLSTPWLALSYQLNPGTLVYASRGFGVESSVAPQLPKYANAGQVLPALKSAQTEVGIKGSSDSMHWSATWFDITRPLFGDAGVCDATPKSCIRQLDGSARHQGLELTAGVQAGPWALNGGVTWLDAKHVDGSIAPALNGKRPVNVPDNILRAQAAYKVAAITGLTLNADLSMEGARAVLPDNSVMLPAWTRVDLGARYETRAFGNKVTWQLNVDNVADRSNFRESPLSFGHVYLFSGAPRTFRLTFQTDF
jgi:iron complex outermembrane receptor protein